MAKPDPSPKSLLVMLVIAVALFATACGGGGSAPDTEEAQSAIAAAESNQGSLQLSGDLAVSELLDARTGEITNLSEVVTGDRAVLVWYWAPH